MSNGMMGSFAKRLVIDLIYFLKPDKNADYNLIREWDENSARELINIIGEPLLKNSLMGLYNEHYHHSDDDLIAWHMKEIKRLRETNK